ncbi:MAG: hypothetical protein QNJ36_09060 [Calothrix sp. MO_167.B42]|nr:hypothetical protein [Calothrix sp. MO_167.B42]
MSDKRPALKNYWTAANNLQNLIPVKEYAKRNYSHPNTVRSYARRGLIVGIKIGGRWYIRVSPIDP